jgi:immunity protein, SdpI family
MNVKPLLFANTLLILAMVALTVWVWPTIPDGAQLPVHWGLDGKADRMGDKTEALLTLPIVAAGVTALFLVLPWIDPRRRNLEKSGKLWNAAAIGTVFIVAGAHLFLVLTATGQVHDIRNFLVPGIAGLFFVLGNYLGKTRSNWFLGVRTPWSLSSDYSWEKTHRWAGRLFVLTGIVTFAAWLLVDAATATIVMIGAILTTSLISIVLSYVYWRADPDRASANGDA